MDDVANYYLSTYTSELERISGGQEVDEELERQAQKYAIQKTALQFFKNSPQLDKTEVWNKIYEAHVNRKCGVDISREAIVKVISADQSWKKSSGHAFEAMIKDLASEAVAGTGASVVLQKDLSAMIKSNQIQNEERDKQWLLAQTKSDTFDLFALVDNKVFGCIQAKTSIRDRVTRDREPSIQAMGRFFWSIVFVLDGDFLKLPKFKGMVNGSSTSYEQNGWHALYAFSLPNGAEGKRIYKLDSDMEPFKSHFAKAVAEWKEQRQWFNSQWTAET
jgi:hypothetical protein